MPRKLVVLLFLGCLFAAAQTITVLNASFETANLTLSGPNGPYCNLIPNSSFAAYPLSGSVADWTASSTSTEAGAGADAFPSGVIGANWNSKWWNGNNLAWMQINAAGTVSMSQALSVVLQNNTTYTLSAMVGRRINAGLFNYALQLWAGSAMLASASNLALAPGAFGTDTVSYSTGANNPQAGQPIVIVLSSTGVNGSETEAHFDEIALSASTAVAINGVISASGFGGFPSIAPGTFIEIYGANLAGETRGWETSDFNGVNAPISLSGTSVIVGGRAAFVSYISPSQVNVLVPSNVATGTQRITLTTAIGTSAPYNITVDALEPGLLAPASFMVDGTQYVTAMFADGTFVLPTGAISGINSRPAKPGDIIVLYGIGFGPVTPNIPAGQIAEESTALVSNLQMFIGGTSASLAYAGLAPSFTGLYQFNITVPNVPASTAVPLTFTLGGLTGPQTLNIAVQQ